MFRFFPEPARSGEVAAVAAAVAAAAAAAAAASSNSIIWVGGRGAGALAFVAPLRDESSSSKSSANVHLSSPSRVW